jgi:hypothetical protein
MTQSREKKSEKGEVRGRKEKASLYVDGKAEPEV